MVILAISATVHEQFRKQHESLQFCEETTSLKMSTMADSILNSSPSASSSPALPTLPTSASAYLIQGEAAPGYESVRATFEANFAEGREEEANLVVYKDGRKVVDLSGSLGERQVSLVIE